MSKGDDAALDKALITCTVIFAVIGALIGFVLQWLIPPLSVDIRSANGEPYWDVLSEVGLKNAFLGLCYGAIAGFVFGLFRSARRVVSEPNPANSTDSDPPNKETPP